MKRSKVIPITATIALITILAVSSMNNTSAATPLDSIIVYMIAEDLEPIIGQNVNITTAIRNALNTTENLYNATLEFQAQSPELNITNVYNVPSNMTNYNSTLYLMDQNNTVPIFWWNSTYVNATWAKFEANKLETFWFIVNCTATSEVAVSVTDIIFTYSFANGTEVIYEGEPFSFDSIEPIPITSQVSHVPFPKLEWYWWLAGSFLIGLPLLIIVITRLTLWKR